MPRSFGEDFERKADTMSPSNSIREVRKTIKKANTIRKSYSNGRMRTSNPLLYLIIGGLVGRKKQLSRAAKNLIKAGVVLGILQLIALGVMWIVSLFM